MHNTSLIKIAIAPCAVLILHILAIFGGGYEAWWWLDIPLHFLGGVAIAIGSYFLLLDFSKRNMFAVQFTPLKILMIMAFTALAAVSWEFFEFALDTQINTAMQAGVMDTMKDLAMGLTGGGLVALLTSFKKMK